MTKFRIREMSDGNGTKSFMVEGSVIPFIWKDYYYNDYYCSHKYFKTLEEAREALDDAIGHVRDNKLSKKRTVRIHD